MNKLDFVIAVIAATGGLGMAAMSLVDASKIVWGGASRIGFHHVRKVLVRFSGVLERAIGSEWETVVLAHWTNGRPRGEQIGVIRSLLRLGLDRETAPQLAAVGNVSADALGDVAAKLTGGKPMTEEDIDLIGRTEAVVEARLDAAFDLADQAYRNQSRVYAGVVAVGLSWLAWWLVPEAKTSFWGAILVGVLAVPIAPIAKDLVSALAAAAGAAKAVRKA